LHLEKHDMHLMLQAPLLHRKRYPSISGKIYQQSNLQKSTYELKQIL